MGSNFAALQCRSLYGAGILLLMLLAFGTGARAEDGSALYDQAKVYKTASWPCPGEEPGFWQASCTMLELGDLSGWMSPQDLEGSATGTFLGKYWTTGNYLKFVATGCARAQTQEEAKSLATYRAGELIRTMTGDFDGKVLTGKFKPLAYRKYDSRFSCTVKKATPPLQTSTSTARPEEGRGAQAAARAEAARQREAEAAEARETTLTVEVRNLDPNTVELGFYSQTRQGHAWPGGDQVFLISDNQPHSYKFSCQRGEKICFGAWRRGNPRSYWASGYQAREGCSNCCLQCGSQHTYTLNANTNDSVASDADTLQTLGTALGVLATGINAANAMNGARAPAQSAPIPGPTYRPPLPSDRGINVGGSDISGRR